MRRLGRRALRLLSVTFVLGALLVTFAPAGSSAEGPMITGWWHRSIPLTGQSAGTPVIAQLDTSAAQVPPPPTTPTVPVTVPPDVTIPDPGQDAPTPDPTPAGGLMVANDPTGPRAMAALRFDAPTAAGGIVTLKVASGSTPAPGVRACPSLSDWQPGPNQGWSRRPAHDCGRVAVASSAAPDGSITFDLPADFRAPDAEFFDVLLVPAENDGTPYQTVFEKPDVNALEVTAELPEDEPVDDRDVEVDLPPTGDFDDFYDSGFPSFGDVSSDVRDAQPTVSTSPNRGDRGALRGVAGVLESPTARRIAALGLVVLAGYAYWQSGQTTQRAPRLLGSLGGGSSAVTVLAGPPPSSPRGIGRFSRVRSAPPPKL